MAEAPLPRASSTAAHMSAWMTPWPRRPARTKKQGKSHTISSSSRARFLMILFRGAVAATYRDRGPQAHQPTGSAACQAKIPIGVELAAAIAPNRRWLPPLSQPAANWLRVTQNAMHQQRRVVLWLSNSLLRSGRSFGSTSRVSMAAPMDKTLPRPGRMPTGGFWTRSGPSRPPSPSALRRSSRDTVDGDRRRRGQVGGCAAKADGVGGGADVARSAGAGQLGLDPPRVHGGRRDAWQPTIPGQGQGDVARLALDVRAPRIVSRPRVAGCGCPEPATPEPSQTNRPRSSVDSR
jgi:hypothetical protein